MLHYHCPALIPSTPNSMSLFYSICMNPLYHSLLLLIPQVSSHHLKLHHPHMLLHCDSEAVQKSIWLSLLCRLCECWPKVSLSQDMQPEQKLVFIGMFPNVLCNISLLFLCAFSTHDWCCSQSLILPEHSPWSTYLPSSTALGYPFHSQCPGRISGLHMWHMSSNSYSGQRVICQYLCYCAIIFLLRFSQSIFCSSPCYSLICTYSQHCSCHHHILITYLSLIFQCHYHIFTVAMSHWCLYWWIHWGQSNTTHSW